MKQSKVQDTYKDNTMSDQEEFISNTSSMEVDAEIVQQEVNDTPSVTSPAPDGDDNSEEISLELLEARNKSRRLDQLLKKVLLREKQVKHERVLLEQRLYEELQELDKNRMSKEEIKNMQRYLAITSPSHPTLQLEDISDDIQSVHSPTPIFQTQCSEETTSSPTDDTPSVSESGKQSSETPSGEKHAKTSATVRKNFLQRNAELSGDAYNVVAMTTEEKQRLADLLQDLTDNESPELTAVIQISDCSGYNPSADEQKQLSAIEDQLKAIQTYCPSPSSTAAECGEKILQDVKDSRDWKEKLSRIDLELERLQTDYEVTHLTEDMLRQLLLSCVQHKSTDLDNANQPSARSVHDSRTTSDWSDQLQSVGNESFVSDSQLPRLPLVTTSYTSPSPSDSLQSTEISHRPFLPDINDRSSTTLSYQKTSPLTKY